MLIFIIIMVTIIIIINNPKTKCDQVVCRQRQVNVPKVACVQVVEERWAWDKSCTIVEVYQQQHFGQVFLLSRWNSVLDKSCTIVKLSLSLL